MNGFTLIMAYTVFGNLVSLSNYIDLVIIDVHKTLSTYVVKTAF